MLTKNYIVFEIILFDVICRKDLINLLKLLSKKINTKLKNTKTLYSCLKNMKKNIIREN